MKKLSSKLSTGLFAVTGLMSASSALAVDYGVPYTNGAHLVGMVNGRAALLSSTTIFGSANCRGIWISPGGGLPGNTRILGTSGADFITSANFTTSFCGVQVTPIVTNGWELHFLGFGGNDTLAAQGSPGTSVFGGEGNDILTNTNNGISWRCLGEGGDDTFQMDNGDACDGGNGNDYMRVASGTAAATFGGPGTDGVCGASFWLDSVESRVCR